MNTLLKKTMELFDEQFGHDQYGGIKAFRQDLVKSFISSEFEKVMREVDECNCNCSACSNCVDKDF